MKNAGTFITSSIAGAVTIGCTVYLDSGAHKLEERFSSVESRMDEIRRSMDDLRAEGELTNEKVSALTCALSSHMGGGDRIHQ